MATSSVGVGAQFSLTTESLGDLAQYQKSPDFPPNKETEWTIEPGNDGWSLSHLAIRGEMDWLKRALETLATETKDVVQDWKLESLTAMWNHHRAHVLAHQTAEDKVLQPKLEERFKYPEKAVKGHKGLENYLQRIDEALIKLKEEKSGASAKSMLENQFLPYQNAMLEHLHAEEVLGVPLMRAYFTQNEFKPVGRAMGKQGGPPGSFVYFMGEDTFRNEFMVRSGMPSFLWQMVFAPALREFNNTFLRHAKAIVETNQPPPPPESALYSCTIL